MSDQPEFGPSGYLPERASKRARKIVLRAPLGLQWVVASVVAGVVVVVAGLLFLRSSSEAPGAPYQAFGPVADLPAARVVDSGSSTTLLVTAGGRVQAFDVTALAIVPAYCPESNRLEAEARVWSLTGRGLGTESLPLHPSVVFEGDLFVDLTTTVAGPRPSEQKTAPAC